MRKEYLPAAVTAALGAAGAVLRKTEIDRVLAADSGLPVKGHPVSIALIVLSLAAVAYAVICSKSFARRGAEKLAFTQAYREGSRVFSYVTMAAGMLVMASALLMGPDMGLAPGGLAFLVFRLFAACMGASFIAVALAQAKRRDIPALYIAGIVPAMFFCMCLAVYYKHNAGNPSLGGYMYGIVSFSANAVAGYYAAGFIYDRARPRAALASNLTALFFAIVLLAEGWSTSMLLIMASVAVFLAVNAVRLCRGLASAEGPQAAEEGKNEGSGGEEGIPSDDAQTSPENDGGGKN